MVILTEGSSGIKMGGNKVSTSAKIQLKDTHYSDNNIRPPLTQLQQQKSFNCVVEE